MLQEIRDNLWTAEITAGTYDDNPNQYHVTLLEQYKIYVEMADRSSNRRTVANAFFLTLNSAIFLAAGFLWQQHPQVSGWWAAFPLAIALAQCVAWFRLVRSYRRLNAVKWAVIGVLEERLPASPYWRGEWRALGEGNDRKKYFPATHIEQYIPILFALGYVGGFLAIVLTA